MNPTPDPLDSLLERWRKATPEPNDRLETEIWRSIAIAQKPQEPRLRLFAFIESIFARPSFTAAFVAACVLLGLFIAEIRVSRLQSQRHVQLVQGYVRLIDPLIDNDAGSDPTVDPAP